MVALAGAFRTFLLNEFASTSASDWRLGQ